MKPRFLADENIDPDVVRGLTRRVLGVDIVRVQEVGFVADRLLAQRTMPGVLLLRSGLAIAQAIDQLALIAVATDAEERDNQIGYLPLR